DRSRRSSVLSVLLNLRRPVASGPTCWHHDMAGDPCPSLDRALPRKRRHGSWRCFHRHLATTRHLVEPGGPASARSASTAATNSSRLSVAVRQTVRSFTSAYPG